MISCLSLTAYHFLSLFFLPSEARIYLDERTYSDGSGATDNGSYEEVPVTDGFL